MTAARKLSSAPPPALFSSDEADSEAASSPASSAGTVVPLRPEVPSALGGRLAATVERMRVLEDAIATILEEADRALGILESDGILDAAGFVSPAEFEERVSGSMAALHAMRSASTAAARKRRTGRRTKRRVAPDVDRTRKTRALESISQTLQRLRELDAQVRRKIDGVRAVLSEIEAQGLYEECGYTSYEEFLDRAIGPSPVLSASINALGEGPLGSPEEPPPRPVDLRPPMPFNDVPATFTELPSTVGGDDPIPAVVEGRESSPDVAPRSVKRAPVMIVTIAMCMSCAILGGAAGFLTNRQALAADAAAEASASAAAARLPTAPCASSAPDHPSPKTAVETSEGADHGDRQALK